MICNGPMNVYFFRSDIISTNRTLDRIEDIFQLRNMSVVTNKEKSEDQFQKEDIAEVRKAGTSLASRIGIYILDVSVPHQEVGYFLALAVLYKKPVLCIYPKLSDIAWLDQYKQCIKDYHHVYFKAYTRSNISRIVQEFLDNIEVQTIKKEDIPSLKFTLRISPKMERYLRWKTINTKRTKADFLRDEIQKIMQSDETYTDYS